MKKKNLILISSFLFALGISACRSKDSKTVIDNGGNNNINDENNNGEIDDGSYTIVSDYVDSDGKLSDAGFARMIKDSYTYCEELVEQGSVLLKNDRNCLPLGNNERNITLFGQGSKNLFYRSGTGGPAPNENFVVDLYKAFTMNGFRVNQTVYDKYSTFSNNQMTNPGTRVESAQKVCTSNNGEQLQDDVLASCNSYNDAAIVTLVRIGTENSDPSVGTLELNSDEQALLKAIKNSNKFNKTIVLINSPMAMSMDWADKEEYGVDAILYVGVPGYYGAGGIAHILAGEKTVNGTTYKVNPSGHLSETFAAFANSSAAFQNYGDTNVVVYKEGVYVGYKYYETRYEDCVLGQGNANGNAGIYASVNSWNYADEVAYPFGYGLSYTNFEQKLTNVTYDEQKDEYKVTVEVKNIGTVDGKSSIQLYVQQPYTDYDKSNYLGKSSIALMAYEKVDLKVGESATKELTFPRYFLCTYDYNGEGTYILEGGDYYFAIGNGAHEALNNVLAIKAPNKQLVDHLGNNAVVNTNGVFKTTITADMNKYSKSIYNSNSYVLNAFDEADYNYWASKNNKSSINYLDRQDWQGTWPTKTNISPCVSADLDMNNIYSSNEGFASYQDGDGTVYNVRLNEPITFSDMVDVPIEGIVEKGKFVGRQGDEVWDEFISQMSLDDLAISITDNRGLLDVQKVYKKGNSISEGPEGLLAKFQYGDMRWATGFPTGPVYTGTWDHNMQKRYGGFFGDEALFCGVSCMNGPKANIKRCAYTSRGSEYMSEDGILNYYAAANIVGEARKKGLIINVGNCFLNNQESGRQMLQTFCNEQAIREIYLKGFEGAVTRGNGLGIQIAYNRIGAKYAACYECLMASVMRGEWGFRGFFISSPLTGSNTSNYSNGPAMLDSGIDIFCLDGGRGNQIKTYIQSNNDGNLLESLQVANKYIMYALSRSSLAPVSVKPGNINGNNQGGGNNNNQGGTGTTTNEFNPITDAVKAKANAMDYTFDPTSIVIPKEDNYDYQNGELASLVDSETRDGHNLVYKFEGDYTEGYQGSYNLYFAHIYLWDDGLMIGKSNNQTFKGYWYNDFNGDGTADCLNMVSNSEKYSSISCNSTNGFYSQEAYIYIYPGWGDGRSMIVGGYFYYPEVDIAIKLPNDVDGRTYRVGDRFSANSITVYKILKNLKYGAVSSDVTINVPNDMLDSNNCLKAAGTYTITATYKNFTSSRTITVID